MGGTGLPTDTSPSPPGPASRTALDRLRDLTPLALTEALAIWRARTTDGAGEPVEFYRLLGERVLKAGEPLVGYDVVSEGLERSPGDLRLRQLLGLSLARSGAPERGHAILAELHREGHEDSKTLGLLARTHKDLWTRATTPDVGRRELGRASETYERAYRLYRLAWPGINAATTALFLGEGGRARKLAAEVRRTALADLDRNPEDYWAHATLGEAGLILGLWDETVRHYREAGRLGRARIGDLATTRRQAHLLAQCLGREHASVDGCFRFPRVVTFSGHMIDRPGRPRPRCCWTPGSAQFWTGDGDHEVGLGRGVFRVSSAARRR